MSELTIDADDRPPKPYLPTAATVLLILAVLGAWQIGAQRSSVTTVQPAAEARGNAAAAAEQQGRSATGQATVAARPAAPTVAEASRGGERARRDLTVYLVASAEQSRSTWLALNEAEVVRNQMGEPPRHHTVMLVHSDDEARVLRVLGASDEVRAALGLPPLTVVDLRAP
jgi:hypothetical protein